jgi:folate-binding protein YgfZ
MPTALLRDRAIILVSGEEARGWLNNLVTCDVGSLTPGEASWGALLTPQGKIIVDFLAAFGSVDGGAASGEGFYLDAPRALASDLAKRLRLYKLRAKIEVIDRSADAETGERLGVVAEWRDDDHPLPAGALRFKDPRLPSLGHRQIMPQHDADAIATADDGYHAHRIALGIAEGGKDFVYGDTFPHEANMDQLDGIDFRKGCYVGQEVVSRMQHRGSGGRTRILPLLYEGGFAASEGADVTAGGRIIGSTGSQAGGRGLAKLRLDRVEEAMQAGVPILAGGIPVTLVKPSWARFRFPGEAESGSVTA